MEIEKHGSDHKDYILFVLEGLKSKEFQENILRIDVFHSSLSVTYDLNNNPTDMIQVHENIKNHGLNVFISNNAKKNGQRVSYQLED